MMALAILGAFLVGLGIGGMYFITMMSPSDNKCYSSLQVRRLFDELYKEIEHGEKEHRIWLWDKINQFLERKRIR